MLALKKLQKQFIDGLNSKDDSILSCIKSNSIITAKQKFAVYQHSVTGTLQKVLIKTYPVCLKLISRDFFIAMINEYIAKTPSTTHNLTHYGESFPDFINDFSPTKSLPYLSDVACLEWSWHSLHTVRESSSLNFNSLATYYETQSENILFVLPESSTLLSSTYPIYKIWEMNQDYYNGADKLLLEPNQSFHYLVWKDQIRKMRIDILSHKEWQILSWIQQRLTLGQIAELIDNCYTDEDLISILMRCTKEGWLCDFMVKS